MRLKTRVVTLLLLCCLLIGSMIFYFIAFFDEPETKRSVIGNSSLLNNLQKEIQLKLLTLTFKDYSKQLNHLIKSLRKEMKTSLNSSFVANSWVSARHVIPERANQLGDVLKGLRDSNITSCDVSRKGTQLKLLLTLSSGEKVLFKPQRYSRDSIIKGIYSGFDRHNGEIVAFHLSRLLGLRSAPIVSSRIINVNKEIRSVATKELFNTFKNSNCFYGQCYYCSEQDLVCGNPNIEGAVILLLPSQYHLQKLRNPWQRTYRSGIQAIWERDENFCSTVLTKLALRPRLLDLIDASIFDFLIGNADRHHYEVFKDVSNSVVLLIDNGKSFGDPESHELTILFPLFQCCFVRNTTYQRLLILSSNGSISKSIKSLLFDDILWPLLTDKHLEALDKRLKIIIALINVCFDLKGKQSVLK